MKKKMTMFLLLTAVFVMILGSTVSYAAVCKNWKCNKTAVSGGYCKKHDPDYDPELCAEPGCKNKKVCGSFCAAHDHCKIKSACVVANYGGRKLCKDSKCGNTANSSGYCNRHDPSYDPSKCAYPGCNNEKNCGSYCPVHDSCKVKNGCKNAGKKTYNSSSASTKNALSDAYDDGYEAVMDHGDYDLARYLRDNDYAAGVDDALDELQEDW